jgi:RTX calcium-binding nonapeptide repeat (4 copies)
LTTILSIGAAVLALGLAVVPSIASSEGVLVLHGSNGPSHPRFSVEGSDLVLRKYQGMHPAKGSDCRNTSPGFRCPLDRYGMVEIVMGPSEDKVEIDSPLPVPVTVHLGDGSDQFIGNDEPDTCYSEGTKRNRCYGNGGNDVCITGNRNSDCVGGPGNDICRHGDGSDGCWGGPGDDVCEMGAGQDGCHGGPGDDRLYGGPGADQLYGGPGVDFCDGGPGVGRSHGCEKGPGH